MQNNHCFLLYNTETEEEATKIADVLMEKRLIANADMFPMNSNYRWKGGITRENRFEVSCCTTLNKKEKIISVIEEIHSDETPGIVFLPIDANQEFLNWIDDALA